MIIGIDLGLIVCVKRVVEKIVCFLRFFVKYGRPKRDIASDFLARAARDRDWDGNTGTVEVLAVRVRKDGVRS